MRFKIVAPALALAVVLLASYANAGLFSHGCSSCCEPACGAPAVSWGSCCAPEPSCCEPCCSGHGVGLLARLKSHFARHHHGGCSEPACGCEPECGAPDDCCEPACGAPAEEPSCGCETSCCDPCGRRHLGGLLGKLFHKHRGCGNDCCEPACGAPADDCCEPACGAPADDCCEPACGAPAEEPSCGCETACCDPCGRRHLGGLLGKLFHKHRDCGCDSACEPACGCEPSCGAN